MTCERWCWLLSKSRISLLSHLKAIADDDLAAAAVAVDVDDGGELAAAIDSSKWVRSEAGASNIRWRWCFAGTGRAVSHSLQGRDVMKRCMITKMVQLKFFEEVRQKKRYFCRRSDDSRKKYLLVLRWYFGFHQRRNGLGITTCFNIGFAMNLFSSSSGATHLQTEGS